MLCINPQGATVCMYCVLTPRVPLICCVFVACPEYYPNCEIQYKGLPNIHTVRKSFMLLRNLLVTDDQNRYMCVLCVCVCVCVCTCVYMCVYILCICGYVCMCVYILCICVYVYICVHMFVLFVHAEEAFHQ